MKIKEKTADKSFNAVKFMRKQRDRITKDIIDLSPEEIIQYFENKSKKKTAQ